MATKIQAKAVIDAADVDIKADIDNILPSGVNIKDGSLGFGPTRFGIILDAGGSVVTADNWRTTIKTNLTNAGRLFTETLLRRFSDSKSYIISETTTNNGRFTVTIINF